MQWEKHKINKNKEYTEKIALLLHADSTSRLLETTEEALAL